MKSPKTPPPQARCGSSGRLLICFVHTLSSLKFIFILSSYIEDLLFQIYSDLLGDLNLHVATGNRGFAYEQNEENE